VGEDRSRRPAAKPRRLSSDATRGAPARPALYGRSHGKTLRAYHARLVAELLPHLEIGEAPAIDVAGLFAFQPKELWLEIGFGGAEHLVAQAKSRRSTGFIGCEPFINGVAKALAAIEDAKLDNLRLRAGDAGLLLEALPPASLSRAYLLYPDPWPKRRHNKRRFVSDVNIVRLARAMRSGAELRFATDVDDYCGWTLRRFRESQDFRWIASNPEDWRRPWSDWTPTRYEAKARREGRRAVYLTFERT
jgi:tRNA (guanine-N7-)-methyltransferase